MVCNRSTVAALTILFLAVIAPPMARLAPAQTARMEIHTLETLTLTDTQFLTGAKDGKPGQIGGAGMNENNGGKPSAARRQTQLAVWALGTDKFQSCIDLSHIDLRSART